MESLERAVLDVVFEVGLGLGGTIGEERGGLPLPLVLAELDLGGLLAVFPVGGPGSGLEVVRVLALLGLLPLLVPGDPKPLPLALAIVSLAPLLLGAVVPADEPTVPNPDPARLRRLLAPRLEALGRRGTARKRPVGAGQTRDLLGHLGRDIGLVLLDLLGRVRRVGVLGLGRHHRVGLGRLVLLVRLPEQVVTAGERDEGQCNEQRTRHPGDLHGPGTLHRRRGYGIHMHRKSAKHVMPTGQVSPAPQLK